jgi:hypothetical protein
VGRTRIAAASKPPVTVASFAIIVVTRSESVVAPLRAPTIVARSAVFTRLPLWPSASECIPSVLKTGWALSHVVEPVVEYRLCPTARSPCKVVRVASVKTWLTRPRSLYTRIV